MRNEEEERKGKERGNVIINLKNKERNLKSQSWVVENKDRFSSFTIPSGTRRKTTGEET
jgi:hypothetical protein